MPAPAPLYLQSGDLSFYRRPLCGENDNILSISSPSSFVVILLILVCYFYTFFFFFCNTSSTKHPVPTFFLITAFYAGRLSKVNSLLATLVSVDYIFMQFFCVLFDDFFSICSSLVCWKLCSDYFDFIFKLYIASFSAYFYCSISSSEFLDI
jgi:hypothetical protein